MTREDLAADIAYVRELAENGRSAPSLGGRFAVMWGGGAVVCLVAHWSVITGRTPLEPDMVGLIWLAYGVIGGVASGFLAAGLRDKPGASAVNNRIGGAVWRASGALIFIYALALAVAVSIRGDLPTILFDTIPPMAFGVYGVSHWVTAAISNEPWCRTRSIASFAACAVSVPLIGLPALYLLASAFVLVALVIPGALQLAREPKSVI